MIYYIRVVKHVQEFLIFVINEMIKRKGELYTC